MKGHRPGTAKGSVLLEHKIKDGDRVRILLGDVGGKVAGARSFLHLFLHLRAIH